MKPNEARRRHRSVEHARAARGRALEAYLAGDGSREAIVPELIPDSKDLGDARREVKRLARLAERTSREVKGRRLDELICALARLVFVESVLALDPLERAALTPSRMLRMSREIGVQDLRARLGRLQREGMG
jgi:hypothetical protein